MHNCLQKEFEALECRSGALIHLFVQVLLLLLLLLFVAIENPPPGLVVLSRKGAPELGRALDFGGVLDH